MKKILIIALIGFILTSCKKSSETTSKSKTVLLTQKDWILTADRTQKGTEAWKDIFSSQQPCEKDNRLIFSSNGKYNITEGTTKCNPSDPQIYFQDETWAFSTNETKISMSHTGGPDLTILQLDESTFKILEEWVGGSCPTGQTCREETTLSHP